MTAQAELFRDESARFPPGMQYFDDIISQSDERQLVAYIAGLPLKPFEFAGGFKGNRRVLSFGWRYDYTAQRLSEALPIPDELAGVRRIVASRFKVPFENIAQALLTEYAPGAGIGWHRDAPMFGEAVVGISLAGATVMRFRRGPAHGRETYPLTLAPGSLYILSGAARRDWQHGIAGQKELRYSITFRTVRRS